MRTLSPDELSTREYKQLIFSCFPHGYFLLKASDCTNLSALFLFIMIKNVAIAFLPDQHASGEENRETTSSIYSR